MDISNVFSARAITLLVFIFVVLLMGTMFNIKLGPEPFTTSKQKESYTDNKSKQKESYTDNKPKK